MLSNSDDLIALSKICIKKINRKNFAAWSYHLEQYINGQGNNELFSKSYHKKPHVKKYKKKNLAAISLLLSTVCKELHPEIRTHSNFFDAWNALARACGKDSIVVICEKLFKLLSLEYDPSSSLQAHISAFKNLNTKLLVLTASNKELMEISSGLLAVFFLQNINQEEKLSSLVQTLYDVKPFGLQTVTDRIGIEQICWGGDKESVMTAGSKGKGNSSSSGSARGGRGGFRGVAPTFHTCANQGSPMEQRLANLERALAANQLSSNTSVRVMDDQQPQESISRSNNSDAGESWFHIDINPETIMTSGVVRDTKLIFDTGATGSAVCNLLMLSDIKEIPCKKIATFSSPLFTTHSGTLKLGDMNISPVLYVPGASVNVLSCAQAEDHGVRVVHKEGLFLLKRGNTVVKSFKR
ncbi:hypothetical protein PTTG_27077 [Puccinia triticina 1-1 BBBD Race 1]|uniref:Uncharacterized protein n=1 Tax=Puccinia triticina (isolate 1-1 / race 1 (BBBD)) TaxID=630390 RepID=A0A180GN56_PUCT1|nr:hypothetical protein PTTG_27077 [Puccinia triticina 1-1 BBBD Race 1]